MPAVDPGALPPGLVVLERGWLSSNNVVFRGRVGAAVVDSGYWTHSRQTLELVARALEGAEPQLLLNTHLHSDHCGGNAALQARYPQVRTLIPPGLAQAVREWDPQALTYEPTGQHCPPFRFDDVLRDGMWVQLGDRRWDVHAAPGHDPHSVILFEPLSRSLISADALWQNGFGVVFPELEGTRAFEEVAATLDLIEKLSPAVVIPGHGPMFADTGAALARARSRLDAYVRNPGRHATHAAKVLLKFKLLELQQIPLADLLAWAENTPYLQGLHASWAGGIPMDAWLRDLLNALQQSGAAQVQHEFVRNS